MTVYCFLQTGNIVGVQRSPEGAMHVFVNGCDLGPAVFGVPEVCIQSGVTRKKCVGHLKTKYAVVKPYCTSLCSLVPRPLSSFSSLFWIHAESDQKLGGAWEQARFVSKHVLLQYYLFSCTLNCTNVNCGFTNIVNFHFHFDTWL